MANEVSKVNLVAIANISKITGLTDANMAEVSGLEFTSVVVAGSYSVSSATLSTARSRCAGFAVARTASAVVGGNNTSGTKLDSCEEYDGSAVSSGGTLGTARFGLTGCGSQTVGLILGGTA